MTPLIKNAVYQTVKGPAEYLGLDTYHGETTHVFAIGRHKDYIWPSTVDRFLCVDGISTRADGVDPLSMLLDAASYIQHEKPEWAARAREAVKKARAVTNGERS